MLIACHAIGALLVASPATAQTPVWTQSLHGVYRQESSPGCYSRPFGYTRALAVFSNGDVVVTGCAENGQDADILTVKYRATDGAILWSATYSGSFGGDDGAAAVAIDGAGNVVITGRSRTATGGLDLRTIKYNGTTGAEIWNVWFNGQQGYDDFGMALAIGPGGHVFVTGQTRDVAGGNENIGTIKYDGATGQQLWKASFSGSFVNSSDIGQAIVVDANGDAFVTGLSGEVSTGSEFRTIKYNGATGVAVWAVVLGIGNASGLAVALDPAGNVIAGGYSYGGASQTDYRVVKYNGINGAALWSKTLAASVYLDQANALAVDGSGNVFVTGTDNIQGGSKMRTYKLDAATGDTLWNSVQSGAGAWTSGGAAVVIDQAGNAISTGYTRASEFAYNTAYTVKHRGSDGVVLWTARYPDNPTDFASSDAIGVDAAGNVLVAAKAFDASTSTSWTVIKHDAASGARLWTSGDPNVPGLAQMASRGLAVSADGTRIGIAGQANHGAFTQKTLVAQYDAATGQRQWMNVYDWENCRLPGPLCAVRYDPAGDLIFGMTMHTSSSDYMQVLKLNGASGQTLWTAAYTGSTSSRLAAIATDQQGNVAATGSSQDPIGGGDMRTVKFRASDGAQLWTAMFDSATHLADAGAAVQFDAVGNVLVLGSSFNGNSGVTTLRVMKYDGVTGAQLWTASRAMEPVGFALDAAGNVLVLGNARDGGAGTQRHYRVTKYHGATGVELWSAFSYGPGNAEATATGIALDSAGNAYVTGSTFASQSLGWMTVKYAGGSGVPVWNVPYDNNNSRDAGASAIAIDPSDNVIVIGYTGFDTGLYGIRTVKYQGASGAQMGAYTHGGAEATGGGFVNKIVIDAAGGIYVGGSFSPAGKPRGMFVQKLVESGVPVNLNVTRAGTGSGSVGANPAGAHCGTDCRNYAVNTVVTLTATPTAGSAFGGWTGCGSVAGNQCTVTLNVAKSVTVTFALAPVARSDFGGDGRSDIVWHNSSSGMLYALPANGLTLGAGAIIDTRADLGWKVAAIADLNGDGKADVIWQHATTGQVYGLLMNGTAVSGEGTIYVEPNTNWKIVGAGDFNGDGKADLLWKNSATGDVFMLLMNGLNVASGGVIYSEPNQNWVIQKVADFNGDGKADIVWRNVATGDVYMMLMNGTAVAGGGVIYSEPNQNWQIQAAADFNGDGRADILWRNVATGDVYMMLMNGTSVIGGAVFYAEPDAAWKIVASGDYNGDGRADILWRNTTSGQVYMMHMNGTAIAAGDFVYTETDQNWKVLGP